MLIFVVYPIIIPRSKCADSKSTLPTKNRDAVKIKIETKICLTENILNGFFVLCFVTEIANLELKIICFSGHNTNPTRCLKFDQDKRKI